MILFYKKEMNLVREHGILSPKSKEKFTNSVILGFTCILKNIHSMNLLTALLF